MFAAWSCRICTSIVFEISKEAYFSMRLYCPLTHPFLGFLLGKFGSSFCRLLCYVPGIRVSQSVLRQIFLCFFAFHG